ncbi:MAG: ATP-binding protein [Chitinophagales bacterium]|nr:ATP-binding protein [Bacteroidota bacterium]
MCITGAESSGKTTLTQQLAAYFDTLWVAEYARFYLEKKKDIYRQNELWYIDQQQNYWHSISLISAQKSGKKIVFWDTDSLVIKIWSEDKYASVDARIVRHFLEAKVDLYLLCKPDIAWTADPLRENPYDRMRLFELYEQNLRQYHKKYALVEGLHNARLQAAISAVENAN